MDKIDQKNIIESSYEPSSGTESDSEKKKQEILAIKENLRKSLELTSDPKEAELIRKRLERIERIEPRTQKQESDETATMIKDVEILKVMQDKQIVDKEKLSAQAEELTRSLGM